MMVHPVMEMGETYNGIGYYVLAILNYKVSVFRLLFPKNNICLKMGNVL